MCTCVVRALSMSRQRLKFKHALLSYTFTDHFDVRLYVESVRFSAIFMFLKYSSVAVVLYSSGIILHCPRRFVGSREDVDEHEEN